MTDPIGIEVPGRTLAYWPGNPVTLLVDWDVSDPAGGHVWTAEAFRGDAGRPSAVWPATVAVDGQEITVEFAADDTSAWGPGTYWRLLRDSVTVLAGKTSRTTAGDLTSSTITVELASPQAVFITIESGLAGPAPSRELDFAEITADITGITIDLFNIDLLSGLAVDIPDHDDVTYVQGQIAVSSSVANATINPILCKTVPTPGTILDSIGMGFVALSAIGSKGNGLTFTRLPPHTPCTVQMYLSGTGSVAAVLAQLYARCNLRAVSVAV